MKFLLAGSILAVSAVNAYTTCMLTCAATQATTYCSTTNYNDTSCLCDTDFITEVKDCLYQSSCNTDVPTWYDTVDAICENVTTTASSSGASSAAATSAAAATSSAAAAASASSSAAASGARAVIGSIGAVGTVVVSLSAVVGGALLL